MQKMDLLLEKQIRLSPDGAMLGYKDVATKQLSTQVMARLSLGVKRPFDSL